MTIAEKLAAHERLLILRILAEANGYTANEAMIDTAMDAWGNRVSRDKIRSHLSWLSEQDVLIIETMQHYMVATLLQRGLDLAEGTANIPGVAKPGPRR